MTGRNEQMGSRVRWALAFVSAFVELAACMLAVAWFNLHAGVIVLLVLFAAGVRDSQARLDRESSDGV